MSRIEKKALNKLREKFEQGKLLLSKNCCVLGIVSDGICTFCRERLHMLLKPFTVQQNNTRPEVFCFINQRRCEPRDSLCLFPFKKMIQCSFVIIQSAFRIVQMNSDRRTIQIEHTHVVVKIPQFPSFNIRSYNCTTASSASSPVCECERECFIITVVLSTLYNSCIRARIASPRYCSDFSSFVVSARSTSLLTQMGDWESAVLSAFS